MAAALKSEIGPIRELVQEQRFAEALRAADALLSSAPENPELQYLRAVSQRMLGDTAAALATLATLERLDPRFSRLYQERGYCYVALKQAPQAIEAFLRGVKVNPALPASWKMLEGLYRMTGQAANAVQAAGHLATLNKLPPAVVTATALFHDGELAAAEQMVRDFLLKQGHHVEAMRLLARIGMEHDVLDDAQLLLEAVLDLEPNYRLARFEYAQVLCRRHLYPEAQAQAGKLLAVDRANRDYRTLYAMTCVGLGQHERAIELYRALLPGSVQPAELHLSIAHSLKTLGQQAPAIAEYRAAAAAREGFGDAWWSLANLKTYRFTDAELGQMRAADAAATTGPVDRFHLCFALGKALEDREQYAASFEYYARGNALKRAASRYRPEVIELNTRLQIEVCTPALFARHPGSGAPAADPIFILGLPRSGSTLIEQILASHSLIEGTMELQDLPQLARELAGRKGPDEAEVFFQSVAGLTAAEPRALGERYLEQTRVFRKSGAPFFIDKMPNNCLYVGLIHLILPNARIIDARRHPLGCGFSCFKQHFARGQSFTYALDDLGRYYRDYVE